MSRAFRGSAGPSQRWDGFDLTVADGVATVTFARPERLNALTFQVYADLRDLLAELPRRDDVAVLVLTGTGRGFCSGGDVDAIIGELLAMSPGDRLAFTRMTGAVVQLLRETPVPVIAAVNGVAAGAGAVLALAADLRVVARSASFAFLFTAVGLAGADMGAAWLLPRLVGLARATELLLLGDRLDAEQAAAAGLATRLVDDADLAAVTAALAGRLAAGPRLAFAATKSLLAREQETSLAAALELDAATQALLMGTADHAEFHLAFTQRRPPRWTGT